MSIAIAPDRIPAAKEKVKKFRRELADFLESSRSKTEVYRLSFQLFPLTKPLIKKGEK
jgi:hypothetical protein